MVLVVAGKLIEIWIFKFYLFYFYLGSADLVSHPFPTTGLQILHTILYLLSELSLGTTN